MNEERESEEIVAEKPRRQIEAPETYKFRTAPIILKFNL
jgi:hypothetical protein